MKKRPDLSVCEKRGKKPEENFLHSSADIFIVPMILLNKADEIKAPFKDQESMIRQKKT